MLPHKYDTKFNNNKKSLEIFLSLYLIIYYYLAWLHRINR